MVKFDEMGIFLGETRRSLGYTQEMVAEIVGVTEKTIRNIEYGVTAAELETILKLWDLYERPFETLFLFYQRSDMMEASIEFYRKKLGKTKSKEKVSVGSR